MILSDIQLIKFPMTSNSCPRIKRSKGIFSPPDFSVRHPVDNISKEIKGEFKDLKEAAEGDAKPEREATSQSAEQAPVLWLTDFTLYLIPQYLNFVVDYIFCCFLVQ